MFERSLEAARQVGDQFEISDTLYSLALVQHVRGEVERAWQLYEACLAIDRTHAHRASEGAMLNGLGHLALLRGDRQQSRTLFRESLAVSRETGDQRRLAFTLSAVAGLVAAENEPERALHFDGAGHAALELLGTPLAPAMRALYNQQLQPANAALGPERATAAVAAGRALTLDEAVDEALAWLDASIDAGEAGRPTAPDPRASAPPHDDPAHHDPAIGAAPGGVRPPPASTHHAAHPGPAAPGGLDRLTEREREVAGLLARGCTNRQIAEALVVSEGTAANYVQRVLNRLGFHNRAQVAAWAVEHGLHREP
jgi:non-specific serine/threonine protein kinase